VQHLPQLGRLPKQWRGIYIRRVTQPKRQEELSFKLCR
jgi:hypothetical protein